MFRTIIINGKVKIPSEVAKFDIFYLCRHIYKSALKFFCKNLNDNMHFQMEIDKFNFKWFVTGYCYQYFDFIESESATISFNCLVDFMNIFDKNKDKLFMDFLKKYRKYMVSFHQGNNEVSLSLKI